MTDEYYTPKEVSELLKVSKPTVYKWIESGVIAGVRIGGTVRVPRDSVVTAIQNIHPQDKSGGGEARQGV